jgi:DNA-binding NarL/FixJ family response regulator
MQVKGAFVDIEDGILVVRIPFKRVIKRSKIEIETDNIHLTAREQEILPMVLELKRNKEIAAELNISERTVKYHVTQLLTKYTVPGRLELCKKVRRMK